MTVERLRSEMAWEELLSWGEFYRFEHDLQKKAQKEAREKAKQGRQGRGRRR